MSVHDTEAADAFRKFFDVQRHSIVNSIAADIERVRPDFISFDFDFPTKHGLQTLQNIKKEHPSLPVIMLTVQHSEALAVWAFRSRVWDYLVKPLGKIDLDRCLSCLGEMLIGRDLTKGPRKPAIPTSLIPVENRSGLRDQTMLAPAIDYVERNYRNKISSVSAASICKLTPFQFSRSFKEVYGLTFQEYVLRFRVREACRLLKNPTAHVTDVAHLVGFNDASYFGKIFRRYTTLSPSRYAATSGSTLDPERVLGVLAGDSSDADANEEPRNIGGR